MTGTWMRYAEFSAFLDWLVGTIEERRVDVLLVAGDVFESRRPSWPVNCGEP